MHRSTIHRQNIAKENPEKFQEIKEAHKLNMQVSRLKTKEEETEEVVEHRRSLGRKRAQVFRDTHRVADKKLKIEKEKEVKVMSVDEKKEYERLRKKQWRLRKNTIIPTITYTELTQQSNGPGTSTSPGEFMNINNVLGLK